MKRIYFVVEGQTEREFVREILSPYFYTHGLSDVRAILIETSPGHKGGFVNYEHLKKLVVRLLKEETNILVTTFTDYFRMPTNMPNYANCMQQAQVDNKIDCLNREMEIDIIAAVTHGNYFVPYIQKYEFESLLFSGNEGFEYCYENDVATKTAALVAQYPNPEEMNIGSNTAPSKRLLAILNDYDKVIDGNSIALELGLEKILEKCPRFRNWIENLILKATH
jgi:uncharacterized protein (DUF2164 family)